MRFARLKVFVRALRFRLMLWNAGAVLMTALVTLGLVREGVRYALFREVDQVLSEDLGEISIAVEELGVTPGGALFDELGRKAHARQDWFVRLFDEQGQEIWSSLTVPDPLPEERGTSLAPLTLANTRIAQQVQSSPGEPPLTIRVGVSLDTMNKDLARIDRQVLLAVGMMIVIAPLSGYWLAGRTTRILADIINTTARLRPRQIGERLPLRNTGDELDQLARTINGFLDRIAAYLHQKGSFLANAAHELRNPMAAIRSSIEVALESDRSRSEYEELLHELIEQCSSLEILVNQLLLLAETEADHIEIHGEVIALDQIVTKSVEMFRGAAEFYRLQLEQNEFPQILIEGNAPHLRQVVNNLLDNALKFTPAGGTVRVDLEELSASGQVLLRVSDTGDGIAPENLSQVFDRFYRGDKSRQRDGHHRGTGLGLSICQSIVQAHGGRISVQSTPGEGTDFLVTLPKLQNPMVRKRPVVPRVPVEEI